MWRNHLKLAVRKILNQRFYSIINIIGLAIGMACCILITLYVVDELSYDRFHEKGKRIYRVDQTYIWGDNFDMFGSTGPAVARIIQDEIPEAEAVVRIHTPGNALVTYAEDGEVMESFDENTILAADSNFFEVFSFKMVAGDPKDALKDPHSVVLTKSGAQKYFGDKSALGKILTIDHGFLKHSFKVSGVIEDVPDQSHFTFDFLTSMTSYPNVVKRSNTWIWTTFVTYALLKEKSDLGGTQSKLHHLPRLHAGPDLQRLYNQTFEEFNAAGKSWKLKLNPLYDLHLFSTDSPGRFGTDGDIMNIYILAATALLIIVLACVNFMSLSTAQSTERAMEVGIRKALGSTKQDLIAQFLFQSIILSTLAAMVAVALVELVIRDFNGLAGKALSLSLLDPITVSIIMAVALVIGLMAGTYPAFYLTSYRAISVLHGKIGGGSKSGRMRNVLVTFQFAISISLIIATALVYEQLNFIQSKKVGFDKNNLLVISNVNRMGEERLETLKARLLSDPKIEKVGLSNSYPPYMWNQDNFRAEGEDNPYIPITGVVTDENYLNTLGVELLIGRFFEESRGNDADKVILNETALKRLGWGSSTTFEDHPPLDRVLEHYGNRFRVIGVLKDFNFQSLRNQIEPLAIFLRGAKVYSGSQAHLSLRLNPTDQGELPAILSNIEATWNELASDLPLNYNFLDQTYYAQFKAEQRIGKVLGVFSVLAIFIACLGLFGLAAFSAEQRTKEIGIRKVLGASVLNLVIMLGKNFARLVGIAFLIAMPVSWYFLDRWLQEFTYRIDMNWWLFVLAGLLTLIIALLTVSFQSIKAAKANPIESLRYE